MKYLGNTATDECHLEVIQCYCGFHIGLDATYVEQVGDIKIDCPACGVEINTENLIKGEMK